MGSAAPSWLDDEVRRGSLKWTGTPLYGLHPARSSAPGCSRLTVSQDGNSLLGTILRILEVFLPFVNLIIFIAQASFQAKWNVGISGRVGLSLFVCIEALVHGGLVREFELWTAEGFYTTS